MMGLARGCIPTVIAEADELQRLPTGRPMIRDGLNLPGKVGGNRHSRPLSRGGPDLNVVVQILAGCAPLFGSHRKHSLCRIF